MGKPLMSYHWKGPVIDFPLTAYLWMSLTGEKAVTQVMIAFLALVTVRDWGFRNSDDHEMASERVFCITLCPVSGCPEFWNPDLVTLRMWACSSWTPPEERVQWLCNLFLIHQMVFIFPSIIYHVTTKQGIR